MKKRGGIKPWWIILFFLIAFFVLKSFFSLWNFDLNAKVSIQKWDVIQKIYQDLPYFTQLKLRRYLSQHSDEIEPLELWDYVFSGSYTPVTFIEHLNKWPNRSFAKIRILEWWSIYDIDAYLTKYEYITSWEYIQYTTDESIINNLAQDYEALQEFISTKPNNWSSLTLEWLLYPDTYHLDQKQSIVPQLVKVQLSTFDKKVYLPNKEKIANFSSTLQSQWYSFSLWRYNMVVLSSIIEKEERSEKNKPIIAGIFLNRIQNNMRIDADITLCYGLKTWYDFCSPSIIGQNIKDTENIYNTRARNWLTPTPIANPSLATFDALFNYEKTNNLYYLHDASGGIWYASDLAWHNRNVAEHL